jgi:hypothetical protein
MKRTVVFLSSCIIIAILSVFCLYKYSGAVNVTPNGFIRVLKDKRPHVVTINRRIPLPEKRFSGNDNSRISLSDVIDNATIYFADSLFKLTIIPNNQTRNLKYKDVEVSDNFVYCYDRIHASIHYGNLSDSSTVYRTLNTPDFSAVKNISPSSFVFRTVDTGIKQYILKKVEFPVGKAIDNPTALSKQVDGYFCTDGILLYNKSNSRIIYIYYYRNQFVCLDTMMNIVYKTNTIDTNSVAKIKVTTVHKNVYTFSAPPLTINEKAATFKDRIYIKSTLLSDKEDRRLFSKSSVIDVYNILDGAYLYSVYLADFDGKKVKEFIVQNDGIIALSGPYLVKYPIAGL